MNAGSIILLIIFSIAIIVLERRWALVPLLACACIIPMAQRLDLGVITLQGIRILILIGFARIVIRGEIKMFRFNIIDYLFVILSVCLFFVGFFYNDPRDAVVFRWGVAFNYAGAYFLARSLCHNTKDLLTVGKALAVLLVPVALEMMFEQVANRNLFSYFGAPEHPTLRGGRLRSQGPFAHSILAGSTGAVLFPIFIGLYKRSPLIYSFGIAACFLMVVTSASSGPILTLAFTIMTLFMWKIRQHLHIFLKLGVATYICMLPLEQPPYYIVTKIDLTGDSQGWYRARLIESAFEHIDEWWVIGTDYTRHWMPTGIPHDPNHADIINFYIQMGVYGGILLMGAYILILMYSFRRIHVALRQDRNDKFILWGGGCSLAGHSITHMSVAYHDQTTVFLFMTIGLFVSVAARTKGSSSKPAPVKVVNHEIYAVG